MSEQRSSDGTVTPGGGLADLVLLLARYWRMIAGATFVGTALMLVVSLLIPKWYEAEVRMLAPKGKSMPSMMMPGGGGGGLSALDLIGLVGGGGSEPNVLATILQSRTVTDAVIAKHDLQKRYKCQHIEETRQTLWAHARVEVDRKSSVISLKVEDKSPQMARDLANTIADEANKLNNRISAVRAGQERRFLEARIVEQHATLAQAEVAMKNFSVQHKMLDIKEQTKASIQAVAKIRAEIQTRDVMLSYLSSFAGEGEENKGRLQREVGELKRQLGRLEEGSPTAAGEKLAARKGGNGSSVMTPIAELPELGLEFARLFRDLKIQETVFELLTKQHEMAKLAEASDTANAQVIDQPLAATYKSRPKRSYYVIFGFLACFVVSVIVARFREAVARDPATAARWRAIREALRSKRA
jgi:tyrosine-protein kinase Etk/Wzc